MTLATSAIDHSCPESANTAHVSVQVTDEEAAETSWWQATGFTPTPINEWLITTSPQLRVTYLPDDDAIDIPVFQVEGPSPPLNTQDTETTDVSSDGGAPTTANLAAFVEEFPGGIRVVCPQQSQPCQEVHVAVAPGEAASAYELTATALRPGCTTDRPVTELTLMRWQP